MCYYEYMKNETEIIKPIKIYRESRLDLKLMASSYVRFGWDFIDYLFVHNSLPPVR